MVMETGPAVQPYVTPYNADDSAYWINDSEKVSCRDPFSRNVL
jgi:hypothetical protein